MKWLFFFGSLVLVTLFLVTTFSHSDAARAAAATYFPASAIDNGLQYSFERRLLFWPLVALRFGLLFLLVATGLARRLTDWIRTMTGDRWFATLLAVGCSIFSPMRF